MRKLLAVALLACVALPGHAQETNVLQLMGCNFKEGKNVDNLWSAVDTVRSVASQPEDPAAGSFVWLPFRSGMDLDFVWGFVNSDLMTMVDGAESYQRSGNARIIGPEFSALADCSGSIFFGDLVTEGVIGVGNDRQMDAAVETFVCDLKPGSDMGDVDNAVAFWKNQYAKVESEALPGYDAFLLRPFRGGRFQMDFGWVGAQKDLRSLMQGAQDFLGSSAGQAAMERFESISRCRSALWTGYWVITPTNRM